MGQSKYFKKNLYVTFRVKFFLYFRTGTTKKTTKKPVDYSYEYYDFPGVKTTKRPGITTKKIGPQTLPTKASPLTTKKVGTTTTKKYDEYYDSDYSDYDDVTTKKPVATTKGRTLFT